MLAENLKYSYHQNKSSTCVGFFLILLYLFFLLAVESLPFRIQLDHLCQRTSLGLRKTLLKSWGFLCILNAIDYIKCQIFSKHFPRDSSPMNSSHICCFTSHMPSAVPSTYPPVLLLESVKRFALAANGTSGSQCLSGLCTRESKF